MPYTAPPKTPPGSLHRETLAVGATLWRLHSTKYAPTTFNPTVANDPFAGGRFDSPDGSYTYLYAGEDIHVAAVEALLRDVPAGHLTTARVLPHAALVERSISCIQVRREVNLVYLSGAGAHAIGQDSWLTNCEARYFPHTRAWAVAIRGWDDGIGGFVWRSRVNNDRRAYVLFGDRLTADSLIPWGKSARCTTKTGLAMLRGALSKYDVEISTP